ncbi:hypothetical protein [Actinomadura nitritigenes]|uniref:hypothetical protein n=1 Tax=Actinomadura nitritigenes TaxID=134602 RepID=UPI003D8A8B11
MPTRPWTNSCGQRFAGARAGLGRLSFALLVAGLSARGLVAGLLPRPVAWIGLVVALAGMVRTLTLVGSGFAFLVPVVRFGGLLWLIAAAALPPRTRHEVRSRDESA